MIWIFSSKILWPFQFNVHVFHFSPLLRENLWKNLLILWLILKLFIIICRLKKIFQLKFPTKKWWLFENVISLLFISATLSNVCEKSNEKAYLFFSIFSNFHFSFICSQNFMTSKLQKKICRLFQYVNQNLFTAPTLNNIFD